jgi:tetratricopeptide (TPR) repeat protein
VKHSLTWILVGLPLSGAGVALPGTALAQYDQAQLVKPAGADDLGTNLSRLASNPKDIEALIGAGNAALALDDPRAAAGFFARADALTSGDGRIKAGLARVNLQLQNPAEAVRLFDQAARLGMPDAAVLVDRGLARDMVGDQASAQRDYAAAFAQTPDDPDLRRRYAASLGISGQVSAAEKMLEPLLYKSDRAGWRYRAFILAMNNRQDEAKKIADQTMPADLAQAITPYLRKMPYLTAAQKAVALHYGHFPMQIGTQIAAITPTAVPPGLAPEPPPQKLAAAEPVKMSAARARAERRAKARERRRSGEATLAASTAKPGFSEATQPVKQQPVPPPPLPPAPRPVEPKPVEPKPVETKPVETKPEQPRGPVFAAADPVVQPVAEKPEPPAPVPEKPVSIAPESKPPVPQQPLPARDGSIGAQLNAITLAQASGRSPATVTPVNPAAQDPRDAAVTDPATPVGPAPIDPAVTDPAVTEPRPADPTATVQVPRSLADIIRAIDVPESERTSTVAAVDLNEIAAMQAASAARKKAEDDKAKAVAKAKAEADAKKKKEAEEKAKLAANPSRNWVQISTGRQRGALGFTLKGLRKKYPDIAPQQSWIASWGSTNRLLIGPFASFERAKSLEDSLKAAGADVFAWKSDAGEVVERFSGN